MKKLIFCAALYSISTFAYEYKVFVPESVKDKKNVPMVVMLHGCTQNADDFMELTKIKDEAEKRGFIVLAPDKDLSIAPPKNPLKCWAWYQGSSNERDPKRGDLKEVMDIVAKVKSEYSVDPDKVYIAGFSAGAVMSSIMASCYPDVFKGAAIHAGIPYKGLRYYLSKKIKIEKYFEKDSCEEDENVSEEVVSTNKSVQDILDKMTKGQKKRVEKLQEKAYDCAQEVIPEDKKLNNIAIFQGDKDKIVLARNAPNIFFQFTPMNDEESKGISFAEYPALGSKLSYRKTEYQGSSNVGLYQIKDMGHSWSGGKEGYRFSTPEGPDATALMLDQFGL